MFDQLFRYPGVVRRHRDGPLAHERATYLASLATRGIAPETLLKYARYCLAVAHVVQPTPRDRSFTTSEIDLLASQWAAGRVQHRRAAHHTGPISSSVRSPRSFSNRWGAGRRHRRCHVPMRVRWKILSLLSNATEGDR